ncbi:Beta-ketoadipate enol-lactone hydrolase [Candidatus Phaeomarinobacter ectocarpi]|uniref:Beta-ketoadipate enol-lactone hydrolase n=1 Tax=Candidatus Phaeomarinibacter ectocarpi TaxID=1458461 RepID=X5M810_9HYPH|nr:alpha/beta hydrolase [Candidatus Phaeomarinobacter ectocarpi]CDO59383.1 Beta-ketoadipate enol-lactone hydrolase [Candidatus Phaeomarinobacter ectocarpi]
MWKFWIIGVLAVLVVGVAIAYALADRETMTAEEFRTGSGYETVALATGVTAYKDMGPKDATPLVIVHGATLGSVAYEAYYQPFLNAGYRVISYDQYGRGFSDRPDADLSIDFMREQLLGLLDYLQIERTSLYGVSFGGAVIARFAAAHPDRVTGLGFQVPLIEAPRSGLLQVASLPVVKPLIGRLLMVPAIIDRGESFGVETEEQRRVVNHFKTQFEVEGTQRMLMSMLTGDAMSSRLADHVTIAAADIPTQFVYATDDPEILPETVEAAIDNYEAADVHTYTGGHFFSATKQDELAAKLAAFFKANGV